MGAMPAANKLITVLASLVGVLSSAILPRQQSALETFIGDIGSGSDTEEDIAPAARANANMKGQTPDEPCAHKSVAA